MKRRNIIIIIIAFILLLGGTAGYIIYDNNRVVSTILMDINPSIKITINKKGKVLNVIPLNEDAKKIVNNNLKGKEIDVVIESITNEVIEKGFVEEGVVILLNTTGNIKSDNIEELVEKKFAEKKVECNIVIQKTNKEAQDNAKKYNISESKASFIEEIIENNKELNFDELKDKSIKELNEIKNNTKEEENEIIEPTTTAKIITNKPNTPSSESNNNYSNPPSDPQDTSGAWCTWNENRPAGSTYYYDKQINQDTVYKQVLEHLGITDMWDIIGGISGGKNDARSSYCIAYRFIITTKEKRYTILTDSVTGKIIEEVSEDTPQPKYTEQDAINMVLEKNNALLEDTTNTYAHYGTDKEGFPDGPIYRYSVSINMKDGTRYSASINAMTGEIYYTNTEKY